MLSPVETLRLLSVAFDYSLYTIGILFIIGIVGNLINILVFTTLKLFRSNQSSTYLTAESIINIGQLSNIFLGRYLVTILGREPAQTSLFWCRMRNILGQYFRLQSTFFVCYAAFDQFLSTSSHVHFRRLSTPKLARQLTIVSICFSILHCIPLTIFVNIDSSLICDIMNDGLATYYSVFYYPVLQGFLPIIVATMLSLLAYRNVRRLIRRQIPIIRRRMDRQLTAMVFVRVICFIISSLPYSIYRIYMLNISMNRRKDFDIYAINKLLEVLCVSLLNINYAITFLIYMVSSARYRRQVKYFFVKKFWKSLKKLFGIQTNIIHAHPDTSAPSPNRMERATLSVI